MNNQPQTVGEGDPYNQVVSADAVEFDTRRFEYAVQRRDALIDRIRFGALTLNGASLVGLLAALGGNGQAAKWLGFTPDITLLSASLFAGGVVFAGLSILLEANRCTGQAADAYLRRQAAVSFKASYAQRLSKEGLAKSERLLNAYTKAPLVDFGYSKLGNVAQSLSTSFWITGLAMPLVNSAGWVS